MKFTSTAGKILPVIFLTCVCIAAGGCVGFTDQLSSDRIITADKTEDEEETTAADSNTEDTISPEDASETDAERDEGTIFVHICGNVKEPGLYELPAGTRAGTAIEIAGGFTKKADETFVNLAAILEDGMQLFVPAAGEAETGSLTGETEKGSDFGEGQGGYDPGQTASAESASGLVNINTASSAELITLPGIGEARAQAILSYREEHGAFSSVEDIKRVSGIGDGIFAKIKERITT